MDETLYEIQDGVRRAKAAQICGLETIPAQIGGKRPIFHVSLKNLRSPHKDVIDGMGVRGIDWGKMCRAALRGESPSPIDVQVGNTGPTLEEVRVDEDDINAFRKKFEASGG